ncbi:MAG: hypothetical protein ACRC33_13380 [Gemmataceae bacterium]
MVRALTADGTVAVSPSVLLPGTCQFTFETTRTDGRAVTCLLRGRC